MIKTFADKRTERLWRGESSRLPPEILRRAMDKLYILHHATSLNDLRVPPANRLEALSGNWAGKHSVRINSQWRLCFRWADGDAEEVEITDYH